MNHEEMITTVRELITTVYMLDKELQDLRVEVKKMNELKAEIKKLDELKAEVKKLDNLIKAGKDEK